MPPKFITIPVMRIAGRQPSGLNPGTTIPIFDQVTMLLADYERIIAVGGEEALRQFLLDERKTDH